MPVVVGGTEYHRAADPAALDQEICSNPGLSGIINGWLAQLGFGPAEYHAVECGWRSNPPGPSIVTHWYWSVPDQYIQRYDAGLWGPIWVSIRRHSWGGRGGIYLSMGVQYDAYDEEGQIQRGAKPMLDKWFVQIQHNWETPRDPAGYWSINLGERAGQLLNVAEFAPEGESFPRAGTTTRLAPVIDQITGGKLQEALIKWLLLQPEWLVLGGLRSQKDAPNPGEDYLDVLRF